jgi:predicted nicotinamide N-methyase
LHYETKIERYDLNGVSLDLEMLVDIDVTIDRLFDLYQAQGKTELFEEMCPYFGTLWPAGRVLAEFISATPLPAESRILEVGCGLALPALYLAKRGLTVHATDVHPDVPTFLEHNRKLNAVHGPTFTSVDWRTNNGENPIWDLVLASDVLYDKTQPASLLAFLRKSVAPGGRVLLADPGRTYVQGFFDDAAQQGFKVKTHGSFGVLIGELTRDVVS